MWCWKWIISFHILHHNVMVVMTSSTTLHLYMTCRKFSVTSSIFSFIFWGGKSDICGSDFNFLKSIFFWLQNLIFWICKINRSHIRRSSWIKQLKYQNFKYLKDLKEKMKRWKDKKTKIWKHENMKIWKYENTKIWKYTKIEWFGRTGVMTSASGGVEGTNSVH